MEQDGYIFHSRTCSWLFGEVDRHKRYNCTFLRRFTNYGVLNVNVSLTFIDDSCPAINEIGNPIL